MIGLACTKHDPHSTHNTDPDSDSALLFALRAGDDAAFGQLVRAHAGRMLALATRYLRDEADANDAVRDAFAKARERLSSLEGSQALSTWLNRILVRAAVKKLRSRPAPLEDSIEGLLPRFRSDGRHEAPETRWRANAPIQGRVVRRCIDRLPDPYRTVLLLTDVDGFEPDEAARLLGIETTTLRDQRHVARMALRTLLDPHMQWQSRLQEGRTDFADCVSKDRVPRKTSQN